MNKAGREFSLAWWLIFIMIISAGVVPVLWAPIYRAENQYVLSCLGEMAIVVIPALVGVIALGRRKELGGIGFRGFPLKVLPFLMFVAIFAQPFLNLVTSPVVMVCRLLFDVEKTVGVIPLGKREWVFAVLSVMVLAPIVEEFIFRGVLMKLFEGYGALTALLMTSLAFSMMHFSPETAVLMFFLGFLLGVIRLSTGSLWAAVIAHSANNIAAFLPGVIPGLYDKITNPIIFAEIILFPVMLCFLLRLSPRGRIEKIRLEPEKRAGFSLGKILSISVYAGYAGIIMAIKIIKVMTYYM